MTHPFHPWLGREFPVHSDLNVCQVAVVRCLIDADTLRCLPKAWTSRRQVDDFERVSTGRSLIRFDDLIALRALIDRLTDDQK